MPFKKSFYVLLAVAIIGILPYAADAAQSQVQLTLAGVRPDGMNDGSYYIDPYQGLINNVGPAVDIWCVDFVHDSYIGATWTVNVTPVSEGNSSNTRLQSEKDYLAILWLIDNYNTSGGYSLQDVQHAIWSYSGYNTLSANVLALVAQANANAAGVNPANWYILTPSDTGNQEFFVDPAAGPNLVPFISNQVPEPGFLLLLGLGIGAASVVSWLAGGPKR